MGSPKSSRRAAEPAPADLPPLPLEALRWRCDPAQLPFESTADIQPAPGIVGQDAAVEALRFGLETDAPGQHVFVRGLSGTGRLTLVRRLLKETQLACPRVRDLCYVHNFGQPDRPRLISLPSGRGRDFRERVARLADFLARQLSEALGSEGIKSRQRALDQAAEASLNQYVQPFEAALQEAGLALVHLRAGPVTQTAIFPLVDGKPVAPEEFDQLFAQGSVDQQQYTAYQDGAARFGEQLAEISAKANRIRREHDESVRRLQQESVRGILGDMVRSIQDDFAEPAVRTFLDELVDDVAANRLENLAEETAFTRLYRVNLVLEHLGEDGCPIVVENAPTMRSLLGTIDYEFGPDDQVFASHMGIRAGSLLRASGGYLILEARDVLSEPRAWKVLVRALRTGRLEIVPAETPFIPTVAPSLKPEPIELQLKVVLLGDAGIYHLLDTHDPDFGQLFKVLVDFDVVIPRSPVGLRYYGEVLARIVQEEKLPHFDRSAVAVLTEHGARIAARRDKLTARFGRLADIAREAAFLVRKAGRHMVSSDDVRLAVRRTRQRADLPSRRFRELVADGTMHVATSGAVVGQINGLAVMQAGPLTYGFPARITATIGAGTAGVINIEREAALSGAIHTKGFYILGGLLRYLLRVDHPLAFDASVAFEQSYGGIDGDSASGAEICCLLSALTDVPLRQDLAMTGAIDQLGHLLAVGGINEKIEGFFDVCSYCGLTGTQGVIIPQANAGDLMLREDLVEVCRAGRFRVYAVATALEALEIMTGRPCGQRGADGAFPPGTLLAEAVARARDYWLKASQPSPDRAVTQP